MKKKTKRILIGILATLMLAGCSEKLMAETTTLLANYVFATGSTVSVPVENMFLPVSEQQMESGSRTYIITTYVYLPNKTLWVGYRSDFYTYYHDGASAGALTQVLDTDGRPMVYEGEISEELLQEFRKTN